MPAGWGFQSWNPPGREAGLYHLIHNGNRTPLIPRSVKLVDVYQEVMDIPIFQSLENDVIKWKLTRSGEFSIKSTYHAMTTSIEVGWSKMVWFKGRIPRFSFVAWMLCWKRLPTLDRLSRWGIVTRTQCYCCESRVETMDHLFFDCTRVICIWDAIKQLCGVTSPSNSWSLILPDIVLL